MRRVLFYVCIGAACLLFPAGSMFGKNAEKFGHSVTVQADEAGFEADLVRQIPDQEELEYTVAVWRECGEQMIFAAESERQDTVSVIEVYGSSRCILPFGKNLSTENEQGCLIGVRLAEKLFGSHQVEGQQIRYKNRNLTVCGVIEEPEELMICETMQPKEGETFERISIFLEEETDAYLTGKSFISQYGISGQMLRFDFYRDMSWLKELIPGKWSDFSGWKTNLEKKQQEIRTIFRAEKSDIEASYIKAFRARNICWIIGIFTLAFICRQIVVRKFLRC